MKNINSLLLFTLSLCTMIAHAQVTELKKSRMIIRFDYEESEKEESNHTSSIKTNKLFFQNLMVGDMRVDGFVTVKNKFAFMNGPRIVSSYEDLTITKVDYGGELYSQSLNKAKKYLPLPYVSQVKPHLSVDYYIWTPKIVNAKPLRKEEHVIFTFPIERLVTVSDHYQNTDANRYFKNFKHESKPDSFFWINSNLKHPKRDDFGTRSIGKVTKISETLMQELKAKLEKYEYEKNRDFWGNKKKNKESKKKKNDDFWNN